MHHDCFCPAGRCPDGNPGGSEEREVAGYGSDGSRHNRRYNTFFCHCFRSDIHIFLPAESAPDLRSRHLEGIYSPRYRSGRIFFKLYGAADAFQSPGSNGTGLYPHRQGERAFGDEGRSETRHEECADPGYHRTGTHCGKPDDRQLCN